MVLIVLASVLAAVAVDAAWLKYFVLNTDGFVGVVGPMAEEPAVQDSVINAVNRSLARSVDVRGALEEQLPANVSFLAGPIDGAVTNLVDREVTAVVRSDRFAKLWESIARAAHTQVVGAFTGRSGVADVSKDGTVTLDLAPVVDKVVDRLEAGGLGFLPLENLRERDAQIELISSPSLAKGNLFVRVLRAVGLILPLFVVLLWLAAVLLSVDRRRALFRIGVGLAVSMVVHLILLMTGRSFYLRAVTDLLPERTAAVVFDLVVRLPLGATRLGLVVGLVVSLCGYLAGPAATAIRFRHAVGASSRRLADAATTSSGQTGELGWWAMHRTLLQAVVVGVAVLRLAASSRVTWGQLVWTVVLMGVGLLVVQRTTVPSAELAPTDPVVQHAVDDEPAST